MNTFCVSPCAHFSRASVWERNQCVVEYGICLTLRYVCSSYDCMLRSPVAKQLPAGIRSGCLNIDRGSLVCAQPSTGWVGPKPRGSVGKVWAPALSQHAARWQPDPGEACRADVLRDTCVYVQCSNSIKLYFVLKLVYHCLENLPGENECELCVWVAKAGKIEINVVYSWNLSQFQLPFAGRMKDVTKLEYPFIPSIKLD